MVRGEPMPPPDVGPRVTSSTTGTDRHPCARVSSAGRTSAAWRRCGAFIRYVAIGEVLFALSPAVTPSQ